MIKSKVCYLFLISGCLFTPATSSTLLHPIDSRAYQRPSHTTCRPLPSPENLVSPHLALYGGNEIEGRLGLDLRWPAIQTYYNFEASLHLRIMHTKQADNDDFDEGGDGFGSQNSNKKEQAAQSETTIDEQFISYKMQQESGSTGKMRSLIQVYRDAAKTTPFYECY